MAFCTKCGANVTGAFCSLCGTPAAGAAASTPPPAAPPYAQPVPPPYAQPGATPYVQPVPGAPPVVVRKTSPVVWVLVIILGLFVLGGISVAAFVGYLAHRVHQAGVSFDPNHDGGFTVNSHDPNGKSAVVQFGGKGKLPSWVPVYPGSDGHANFSVRGTGDQGEAGNFTFTTADDPEKVKAFYSDKAKDMGMKLTMDTTTPQGGMIIAADEGNQRTLEVVVGGHTGETTVNVTYGRK